MASPIKKIAAWFSGRHSVTVGSYRKLDEEDDHTEGTMMHSTGDNRLDSRFGLVLNVKQEDVCPKVLSLIIEKEIKMLAICGSRGAGKSNLLRKIEQEALNSKKFSTVIYITLPHSGCIEEKIIYELAKRKGSIHYPDKQKCREDVLRYLHNSSFLVLIDDLIRPGNFLHDLLSQSKKNPDFFGRVVFTTRNRNLARDMSCPSLHVSPLRREQSLSLVSQELQEYYSTCPTGSEMISDSKAMKLVEEMVRECHGLPLALKVVAGALKGEERRPLEELREAATELRDPVKLLRFAVDCLPSDAVRECFIYTALYPKDHSIPEEELIQLWIGEELLLPITGEDFSITRMIQWGQEVIKMLKSANLLAGLPEKRGGKKCVGVNNTLRSIILRDNEELLVESGAGLDKPPMGKKWELVKRVSLISNDFKEFKETPRCSWLETMLLHHNKALSALPNNFFEFMPRLRVLDLSHTSIGELPPSIGKMVELQYLNLSFTFLQSLPEEMGKLKKLKWLSMRRTVIRTKRIPSKLLSNFVELQYLNTFLSSITLNKDNCDTIIQEMERMENLEIVGIHVDDLSSLQKLSNNKKLVTKMERVQFSSCPKVDEIELSSTFRSMENLKELLLYNIPNLKYIVFGVSCFKNLERLELIDCRFSRSISWAQCLPNLVEIVIRNSDMIEILFNERVEGYEHCFPKLKSLTLSHLRNLLDIGDSVAFPSLQTLRIYDCPMLKKLPKDLVCGELKEIRGSESWWNNICMDESARSSLSPYFISLSLVDCQWESGWC